MCGHSRKPTQDGEAEDVIAPESKEQSSSQQTSPKHSQQDESSQDSLIAHIKPYNKDEKPSQVSSEDEGESSPKLESSSTDKQEPQQQQQQHNHDKKEELKGDENFLVGITPQYWAHVPMLISDIHNLILSQGGINFYCGIIPVSKCLLVGRIVASKPASDNSIMYVVDDGTGLIDCTAYHKDSAAMDGGATTTTDVYELPSLLPTSQDKQEQPQESSSPMLSLGTCVKVYGKIKNLAISNGTVLREISAQILDPVKEAYGNNHNPEHDHWVQCVKFLQANHPILQPLGCLQLLGSHIQAQVRAKRQLPSADDTLGAWRVFGIADCTCSCSQRIKTSLLYCHCQAKSILQQDAQFQYKEALLTHLLERQTKHVKMLVFGYHDLKQEESLLQVAMEQQQSSDAAKQRFFHEELLRATVRALVKDGIIFHIDPNNDEYLLITRERVLEPFVRDELERTSSKNSTKNKISLHNAPDYMQGVDKEKLLYIKRCLLEARNDNDSDNREQESNPRMVKRVKT